MFTAIILLESENIQYSKIREISGVFSTSEKFNQTLIQIENPPDFEKIRVDQEKIYNFNFSTGKKFINNFFEKEIENSEMLYQTKLALQDTTIVDTKISLLPKIDQSFQPELYLIIKSKNFDDIWNRAVLIESVENSNLLENSPQRKNIEKILLYSKNEVEFGEISSFNAARIIENTNKERYNFSDQTKLSSLLIPHAVGIRNIKRCHFKHQKLPSFYGF